MALRGVASALVAAVAAGQCNISNVFGDHMVLQRDSANTLVWGFGSPGDSVQVSLDGQPLSSKAKVGSDGIWRQALPSTPASTASHTITATCSGGSAQLQDVLFGDVFLCGGQSNMQFTLPMAFNSTVEIARAQSYPSIRVMTVTNGANYDGITSLTPLTELARIDQVWSVASSASIGVGVWSEFSAVCWLFGRNVYDALGRTVPIGLISSNWGGTRIEAWVPPNVNAQCNATAQPPVRPAEHRPERAASNLRVKAGSMKPVGSHTTQQVEVRPSAAAPGQPDPNTATVLYNAMIWPFKVGPMALKGFTWFQGESNQVETDKYACLFPACVQQWKSDFAPTGRPEDGPWFGFVILEPYLGGPSGQFRDAQMGAMAVNYTGYASAIDIGDPQSPFVSYHPRAKQIPSARLAATALAQVYGKNQQWTGAVIQGATGATSNGVMTATVSFQPGTATGGLVVKPYTPLQMCPINLGVAPSMCAWPQVQASNGQWVNATLSTSSDGSQLIFTAPAPSGATGAPTAVQYGYGEWPAINVYSSYSINTGYEVIDFPMLSFSATVSQEEDTA